MITKSKDGTLKETTLPLEAEREKYFSIERDKKYPCFCQACLVGKKPSEMSQRDIRYCLECQPIIEYEYNLLADRSQWKQYKPVAPKAHLGATKPLDVEMDTHKEILIMSTSNENLAKGDIIQAAERQEIKKRGPKHKVLPVDLIKQLHAEGDGLGAKAIASKLKAEQGIEVSYKTIQRVLSSQRTGKEPETF